MAKRGERYYTLTEVAAELGMLLPSVSRAASTGRLITVEIGGTRMVAASALTEYRKVKRRGRPRVWKPKERVGEPHNRKEQST
jgi:hypothetical protein